MLPYVIALKSRGPLSGMAEFRRGLGKAAVAPKLVNWATDARAR